MTRIFAAAAAFATAITFSAAASATIFSNDYHDDGVWSAYDDTNEVYAMKYRSDLGKDGFWLVVSDGPNPKANENKYAILYGDTKANRITAYNYSGENNADSYKTGTLLGTYDNVFVDGGQHRTYGYDMTMFNIDVAGINSAFGGEWMGVQSGPSAGIWFHQSAGSDFTYGADGGIANYTFDNQMWLDRANDTDGFVNPSADCVNTFTVRPAFVNGCSAVALNTTPGGGSVPAPGGLALVLAGLFGLRHMRRRHAV